MIYVLIVMLIIGGIYYSRKKRRMDRIKRNGVRVTGTIIQNKEIGARRMDRLGANINEPVIRFSTLDGREVVGQPITGFTSQREIIPPFDVYVVYDASNPSLFYIDWS